MYCGSASTGKYVLTEPLTTYFNNFFVPEISKDIIIEIKSCTIADLYTIAALHAKIINHKMPLANKLLTVDTDIIITRSYGSFIFEQLLLQQIGLIKLTGFALYLFFETD